jgi:serine/threonine-protein kinase
MSESNGMQLVAGTRLGQYRIEEHLGMGGMGTVYKATDTTLGREVALKMLHPEMLEDPANMARFEREARTLASLNHPHIGVIYGLETHESVRFLALEYVSGLTLAELIRRRAIPVREAVPIAQQIAEALEAAHAKGIIHRDLKPANIKVSESGQVKVLDFGLAKSVTQAQASLSSDATLLTEKSTEDISLAGTPAYMSPEQASGKKLDSRTDIWSFGCILYEMLAGQRAFSGTSITEILAAVLEREPDWTVLPVTVAVSLRNLIKRCLRKDPNSRLRDIGDARIELEDVLSAPAHDEVTRSKTVMTRRTAIGVISGAVAGAAGAGVYAVSRNRSASPRSLTRFSIAVPEGNTVNASFASRLAIAPDGGRIGISAPVAGSSRFYVRSLSDLDSKFIKDVNTAYSFFSPDGRWVGYFTPTPPSMRKIALAGGAPVTIFPRTAATGNSEATWADDDTIYFVFEIPGGIMSVPAAGGEPKEILPIDTAKGERTLKYPHALPGGRAVLYTVAVSESESFDDAHIAVFSPRTGQKKVLVEGGTHPRYSASGHLVYARNGNLLAVGFDPDRLEVRGQPVVVLEGVLMSRNTGAANFDISPSGDLAYAPGICEGGARTLHWVDRSGHAEKLPLPARSYLHPRISPDASKLAIEIEGANHDCYIYDLASGVLSNITTDGISHWPLWSADGQTIGYRSGTMGRFQLWQVPADRSRPPAQVIATGYSQNAESYSPDGRAIVYTATDPGSPSKVIILPLQGGAPQPLDNSKYAQGSPKFSPDGRWLAYCSVESGKPQVYVQAFPGPGAKTQVSNEGGTDPVWKRDGSELFFRNGDSMMAVPISKGAGFSAGRPHELWKGRFSHGMSSSCGPAGVSSSNYDVTADGQRFLMIKDEDQDTATSNQIVVVLGWADELRRIAGKA